MGANCVASASIGVLWCCKGCNAEKLRTAFTFVPPSSTYAIEDKQDGPGAGSSSAEDSQREKRTCHRIVYRLRTLANSEVYRRAAESAEVHFVRNKSGNKLPLVWVKTSPHRRPGSEEKEEVPEDERIVLLHCHGNAADIGMMMGSYYEMSKVLGIQVLGAEYSGYGTAEGKPSAGSTQEDIEAAYDFLIASGVSPNRIVVYGQSVGTGPASRVAASREVRGLVLHSAMLSGIKVIDPLPNKTCRPSCVWRCFDFYPTDQNIKKVQSPTLVMHGQQDDIIPFYHGYRLHKAVPKEHRWPPYFPEGGGHNDLVEMDMHGYFSTLDTFLTALRKNTAEATIEKYILSSIPPQEASMSEGPRERLVQEGGDSSAVEMAITNPQDAERAENWHAPEPRVGPDDGRYDKLRGGPAAPSSK